MTLTSGNRDLTQPWVRDLTHPSVNSTVGSNVRYNVEKKLFLTYDYSLSGLYNL